MPTTRTARGQPPQEWSAKDWAELVRAGAEQLPAGSRIELTGGNAFAQLCWFLAADRAGCATLIADASWTPSERAAVRADAATHTSLDVDMMPLPAAVDSAFAGTCSRTDDAAVPRPVGDERTWFYLPTSSGSSGRPKVLARSRSSWLRSYDVFDIGMRPGEEVLVPGPLSSSLFLFAALHALHVGAHLRLLDTWSFSETLRSCANASTVHLVPTMLAALVDRWERDAAARTVCRLSRIVCGGARVDPTLRTRLGRVLPDCELVEYYGAAETSLIALHRSDEPPPGTPPADGSAMDGETANAPPRDDGPATGHSTGASSTGVNTPAGPPGLHPVVDVHIDEKTGELRVRSPLRFAGYLHNGELVGADPVDGWASVGDRAERLPGGQIRVLGRSSSTINTGGTLVQAEEVEAVVREVARVRDVVVVGTAHERFGAVVTAVVEAPANAAPRLAELRSQVRAVLKPAKRPRHWLRVPKLPRTASGKPARERVSAGLRAATLPYTTLFTPDGETPGPRDDEAGRADD